MLSGIKALEEIATVKRALEDKKPVTSLAFIRNIDSIEALRTKDGLGNTVFWYLALICTSTRTGNLFQEILEKFHEHLVLEDMLQADKTTIYKNRSVLWFITLMARFNPDPLKMFWRKWGAQISHADLLVTPPNQLSTAGLFMEAQVTHFKESALGKFPPVSPVQLPPKKFLLAVDLDYTHFIYHENGIKWIGSDTFWFNLYSDISKRAAEQGVHMLFAIMTHKDGMDELVIAAVRKFRLFLEKHHPYMFIDQSPNDWSLTEIDGKLHYSYLSRDHNTSFAPENVLSHIMILNGGSKSAAIKKMASFYDIPLQCTLLMDDDPEVLKDAISNGIETVSCEYFCCARPPTPKEISKFDDQAEIEKQLVQIRAELMTKCQRLITLAASPEPPKPAPSLLFTRFGSAAPQPRQAPTFDSTTPHL